jgi:hypothetical protein
MLGGIKMVEEVNHNDWRDAGWKSLYRVGGAAALLAGIIFRRNLGVEFELFSPITFPETVGAWFTLLQDNRLIGVVYLHIFDLVHYALAGLVFLALFVALKRTNKSFMLIAATTGLVGITVYFASNTAFSMLSLSDQYLIANSEAEQNLLLGAGKALLAQNRFSSPGAHPGSGGYISLFLIAIAGLMTSIVMLRGKVFNRATAYVGILAGSLDIAYCIGFAFFPSVDGEQLALLFIPAAGLFWMIWYILVGWRLYRLGKETQPEPALL